MRTLTLADIVKPKLKAVEIKNGNGDVEGVTYLREMGAKAGALLQDRLKDKPWYEQAFTILADCLCDEKGRKIVQTDEDLALLEEMPPSVIAILQQAALDLASAGFSVMAQTGKDKSDDIDHTLAKLDDQVARTYAPGEPEPELSNAGDATGVDDEPVVTVPIDGNENLHLDQDSDNPTPEADSNNPFVATAPPPS